MEEKDKNYNEACNQSSIYFSDLNFNTSESGENDNNQNNSINDDIDSNEIEDHSILDLLVADGEDDDPISDLHKSEYISMCILTLFYSGKLTQSSLILVIKLLNIITNLNLSTNFNSLSKSLLSNIQETISYEKKWFCSLLNIFYWFNLEEQIKRLFKKKILPTFMLKTNLSSNIEDIYDGNIYKEYRKNLVYNNNQLIEKNYSFILNTDGIELSQKSTISIWPVYLAINELPIQNRYFIDNILIAGILVSDGKPKSIDYFFDSIISSLRHLELGLLVDTEIYRFFTIFGVFDKPARALMLKTVSSNGHYGCLKCRDEGCVVSFKNGYHHIFPYKEILDLRNHSNYLEDLENSKLFGKASKGIKDETFFSELKYYKPIDRPHAFNFCWCC
ncbi:unnamed protein product [Brachionus calyciflorus]|uniref:Uncharacterized protein n=1 Tax=Brachionus calyciflorus TaxID=104777 RepID=A0A813QGU5_9BILA|nr:unnamed protein product [Brachionus calyciflorus]